MYEIPTSPHQAFTEHIISVTVSTVFKRVQYNRQAHHEISIQFAVFQATIETV